MTAKSKTIARVSDDAVKMATGKVWKDWFKILDREGSSKKSHREIAQWLYDNFPVGGWWSQMLTVEYEKEKGIRDLYEKPAGYEISVSKTFNTSVKELYKFFSDSRKRSKWLKDDFEISTKSADKSLRAKWKNGVTRISVNFYPAGEKKSRAVVQHLKLKDKKQADAKKIYWTEHLNSLSELLSAG